MLPLRVLVIFRQAPAHLAAGWANIFVFSKHFILQYRATVLIVAHDGTIQVLQHPPPVARQ
jgi:hypothetical protein